MTRDLRFRPPAAPPKVIKAFEVPPTGSILRGDPDYQPFGHMLRVKLNGLLVLARTHGIAVQRYNIPQGWIEGRPADKGTGKVHTRHPRIRMHGRVEIEMWD